MVRRFRITIDLPRLRENMSRQEGRALSDTEIRQWLQDAGFAPAIDETWIIDEPDLGQLDPSEVQSVEEVVE
jgi:hypothetical protein